MATRILLVVLDGLRPDLVTPELTPTLARLADEGTWFERSHAVVPTVTRVNSATLATGTVPAVHGLAANLLFAPEVDAAPLSLGEADTVPRLMRAYGVFAAPTLADVVVGAGGSTALVSSGTRGSALMLDPRRAERGHLTLHPTLSTADELGAAAGRIGSLPDAGVPDSARNGWLTRAITEWVVPELGPDLLMVWFDDPDKSQHKFGFGHPESLRAIREADANLAGILGALDGAGRREETVVAVASDHGYASVRQRVDLAGRLTTAGLDRTADGRPVVVAQNGCAVLVYAPGGSEAEVGRIAQALLREPEVGVIFSGRAGRPTVDGTFQLDRIGIGGPLAPDLLVTLAWDDEPNEHGYPGRSYENGSTNRASHGGASPREIRNTMLLAGPGIRRGVCSELPSGSADLAPTLLTLLGLAVPSGVDGRVLREALTEGKTGDHDKSQVISVVDRIETGSGAAELHWSQYASRSYLDFARRVEHGS